jgi:hypothetical protein
MIKKLIHKGADYTLSDNKGRTPFLLASEKGKEGIIYLLKSMKKQKGFCSQKDPQLSMGKNQYNSMSYLLFTSLHTLVALLVFFCLMPCKSEY